MTKGNLPGLLQTPALVCGQMDYVIAIICPTSLPQNEHVVSRNHNSDNINNVSTSKHKKLAKPTFLLDHTVQPKWCPWSL